MEHVKSQRLIKGAGVNRFNRPKKSTPHYGRVGYGAFPAVSFRDLPKEKKSASRGFTSEIEVLLIFALIGFWLAI